MRFMLVMSHGSEDNRTTGHSGDLGHLIVEMEAFHGDLLAAGALLAAEALAPSQEAQRIEFSHGMRPMLVDGLGEGRALTGFWIIEARTREAAIEWALQAPLWAGRVEVRKLIENDALATLVRTCSPDPA